MATKARVRETQSHLVAELSAPSQTTTLSNCDNYLIKILLLL